LRHSVAGSDVPGNEYRNLGHHPIGKGVGWRKVRNTFQGPDDLACLLNLRSALGTIANMGLQGGYPEAHLVINEKVDFVWKQVPMIHRRVLRAWV
jgi:hypothetical protein